MSGGWANSPDPSINEAWAEQWRTLTDVQRREAFELLGFYRLSVDDSGCHGSKPGALMLAHHAIRISLELDKLRANLGGDES